METNEDIIIHLGLHKTGSTFLQKEFFPLHRKRCGYVDARKQLRGFLDYILYSHDFEFDSQQALQIFNKEISHTDATDGRVLISDEQFCGSPWDNAAYRRSYFDRLNSVFPMAKYIIVLRNQTDMIRSLYLQYIKTGGTATWKAFIGYKRHPLSISLKGYFDYGAYIKYMVEYVGIERVGCFFYEDMKKNPMDFLKTISSFSGFETKNQDTSTIINRKKNPSISNFWVGPLRMINPFFKTYRQPFSLLPRVLHAALVKLLARVPVNRPSVLIPQNEIDKFCNATKQKNEIIADIYKKDISEKGY